MYFYRLWGQLTFLATFADKETRKVILEWFSTAYLKLKVLCWIAAIFS